MGVRKKGRRKLTYNIIDGMIPTTYFPKRLETTSTKVLNLDGVDLPKEITDKIIDDFEQEKYKDEHTPKMLEAAKYSREWGFDYDQYIKYIINGEK